MLLFPENWMDFNFFFRKKQPVHMPYNNVNFRQAVTHIMYGENTSVVFSFSVLHFLVVVSVRQIKLTDVGFQAHVKIASRIVSYHIVVWPTLGSRTADKQNRTVSWMMLVVKLVLLITV